MSNESDEKFHSQMCDTLLYIIVSAVLVFGAHWLDSNGPDWMREDWGSGRHRLCPGVIIYVILLLIGLFVALINTWKKPSD